MSRKSGPVITSDRFAAIIIEEVIGRVNNFWKLTGRKPDVIEVQFDKTLRINGIPVRISER